MAPHGRRLGALLALARRPWYWSHLGTTRPWGLTPLEDQQLAGLIMWIPGGLFFYGVMSVVFFRWVSRGAGDDTASAQVGWKPV